MPITKIDLDEQAESKVFTFGTTTAGEEALVTLEKGTQPTSYVTLLNKASQQIDGNLFIGGNLTVVGSYDTQTVTDMSVKDKTITLNNGGTTAGSTSSGIEIEGDSGATIGAFYFNNALTNKFSIGDGTTQKEIATVDQIPSAYFRTVGLSGTQNGVNVTFTLASAVSTNSDMIIKNGQVLKRGVGNDYTISGTTITFSIAPKVNTVLEARGHY